MAAEASVPGEQLMTSSPSATTSGSSGIGQQGELPSVATRCGIMDHMDEIKLALAHLSRDQLNSLIPVVQPQVESEAEHFYVCGHCGQAVDYRRLGDVLYHDEPGHEQLPVN
jgi:hypothetical protein